MVSKFNVIFFARKNTERDRHLQDVKDVIYEIYMDEKEIFTNMSLQRCLVFETFYALFRGEDLVLVIKTIMQFSKNEGITEINAIVKYHCLIFITILLLGPTSPLKALKL